jgi:hypothetical protein
MYLALHEKRYKILTKRKITTAKIITKKNHTKLYNLIKDSANAVLGSTKPTCHAKKLKKKKQ